MKKHFFILLLFALVSNAFAQRAWTVGTVPNTRLQSNVIHVSDPDGYLSDSAEMTINTALCAIRDTADVFLVTLGSIGEAEPKPFATDLFNRWGIGDAGKNNGVLLLFVEDQHALEFETGYGAEATLTDAMCQSIFTKVIVPYFRGGDYEGGLCAGVAAIVEVYGGEIPVGLTTTLPDLSVADGSESSDDSYTVLFLIFSLIMVAAPLVGLALWIYKRKEKPSAADDFKLKMENGVSYISGMKTKWTGSPWEGRGCLGALMLGGSIFVILFIVIAFTSVKYPNLEESSYFNWVSGITLVLYFTWVCFRQNRRVLKKAGELAKTSINPRSIYEAASKHTSNRVAMWMAPWLGWFYYRTYKKRIAECGDLQCPTCGATLQKDRSFHLSEIHETENRLNSINNTPYRCANGHEFVVCEHGTNYKQFTTCAHCGGYTSKLTNTVTLEEANYSHSGKKKETYTCQHCGDTQVKTIIIPMKVRTYSSGSSSGSSSSGRSYSSHSSGGSFGGGRSGGGGFSGRW
jgi:uncharacterized protein